MKAQTAVSFPQSCGLKQCGCLREMLKPPPMAISTCECLHWGLYYCVLSYCKVQYATIPLWCSDLAPEAVCIYPCSADAGGK